MSPDGFLILAVLLAGLAGGGTLILKRLRARRPHHSEWMPPAEMALTVLVIAAMLGALAAFSQIWRFQ